MAAARTGRARAGPAKGGNSRERKHTRGTAEARPNGRRAKARPRGGPRRSRGIAVSEINQSEINQSEINQREINPNLFRCFHRAVQMLIIRFLFFYRQDGTGKYRAMIHGKCLNRNIAL